MFLALGLARNEHRFRLKDPLGRCLKIPDYPCFLESKKNVIGEIDLPPEEALAGRKGIVMVIVVPALAHRDEREPETVLALLAGLITASAEHVAERINGEGGVIKEHRADEEADDQSHHGIAKPEMADKETECTRNSWRDENVLIQPDQFGKLVQVPNDIWIVFFIFLGENPADVRPIEAFQFR